jgi:hypothetical protein
LSDALRASSLASVLMLLGFGSHAIQSAGATALVQVAACFLA